MYWCTSIKGLACRLAKAKAGSGNEPQYSRCYGRYVPSRTFLTIDTPASVSSGCRFPSPNLDQTAPCQSFSGRRSVSLKQQAGP
ncbi:hypothetical protein PSTT_01346 [Puccinia striiformis]|uniref:Uncharacterized protein n=1 Tax=Puccinia striiformis TaxID=27350 RepID=A0A2S4W401_9BASI|nr:hypothetical protein PSTT_01346 [Puccinia striiformis]